MKNKVLHTLIILLISFQSLIFNQDFWEATKGPYAGSIRDLSNSPDGYLFAVAQSGVFRSIDGGNTWTRVMEWLSLSCLTVRDDGAIFIGAYYYMNTPGGVWRSTDNGDNWVYLGGLVSVGSMAINASGHIFIGGLSVIYLSTDNGDSWSLTSFSGSNINTLIVDSMDYVYAGTNDGVFRSVDNGENWTPINTGLTDFSIKFLAYDSAGNIFAGSESGIYRTTTGGDSWMFTGLEGYSVVSIGVDYNNSVYAGTSNDVIFLSVDSGNYWEEIGSFDNEIGAFTFLLSNDVLAGTSGNGIFKSGNPWNEWIQIGLPTTFVGSLVTNSNGDIFAGANWDGLFMSSNNGESWGLITPPNNAIRSVALNSSDQIFAGTTSGIIRSIDYGNTWSQILTIDDIVLCISINSVGNIYAGTNQLGVFRSVDNGDSWLEINNGLTGYYIKDMVINSDDHIFIAVSGESVFRSTDNGDNWIHVNNGLTNNYIWTLGINSNDHIFAGGNGYFLFRTMNNGESWTQIGSSIVHSVRAIVANTSGKLFASVQSGVIFSMDNGESWTQINDGLSNPFVKTLAIDSDGLIFAGMYGSGVFRSIESTNLNTITLSINLSMDWNMIGLPLEVGNSLYISLFPESIEGTLYSFDSIYQEQDILEPGAGYWLKFNEENTVTITGYPIFELALNVSTDWNMFSGISYPVDVNAINDPDELIVPGTIYGFDGTYVNVETIEPGKGYWLRSYATGELIISSTALAKTSHFVNQLEGANSISFNGQSLYFGVNIPDEGKLSYSLPPKPPSGCFDVRFSGDWNYCGNSGEIELMNNSNKLAIAYNIMREAGENKRWVLENKNTGKDYVLDGTGEIEVSGNVDGFILSKEAILPEKFVLHPNYPNPFNPVTTIRYELPKESHVAINIYDITGREVAELVEGFHPPGFYQTKWDGGLVASGVYFVKMTAQEQSAEQSTEFMTIRKIMLVK